MAGSSQELEPDEFAALLARKATEDAVALREFAANTEIADTVLGFHAQQAIGAVPLDREVAVKLVAEIGDWANNPLDASSK